MVDICIVGEAWGREEEAAHAPFVGPSGKLLSALLSAAGINRNECFLTNVFNLRPKPTNDISNLCGNKAQAIPNMRPLASGRYVRAEYGDELLRLWRELRNESPNLIIALGGTPLWALTGQSSISKNRGTIIQSHLGFKVLPTYHPAAVIRNWSLRPIVIADLQKARRESEFPEVRRPNREVWLEPTIEDLKSFKAMYLDPADLVSVDIENSGEVITCVGLAPDASRAIVVPFVDREQPDGNYWRSHADEVTAWSLIKEVCTTKPLLGQNYAYDMNVLWRTMGLPCPGFAHDTMLMHHALQPEMEKGLGFLGSVYTDESSWKMMRKTETLKRED